MVEQSRSPELLALDEKYRKLREIQPVHAYEPKDLGGISVAQFVELTGKVAQDHVSNQTSIK